MAATRPASALDVPRTTGMDRQVIPKGLDVYVIDGVTSISQINFFLSLVKVKRVLFSPLVIVGSQIFERPSGGRYGGRWISDGYFKSDIW